MSRDGTDSNAIAPDSSASDRPLGASGTSWFSQIADRVLDAFPDQSTYTCAAGISPSGIVHFGNFRDVITAFAVASELRTRGHATRLLFSWDDFDRLRKVPNDVDPGFARYIGFPLAAVPDPFGQYASYAQRHEAEFEASMKELAIDLEYRYQSKEYGAGKYAEQIGIALRNRTRIAEIQLSFKTEKVYQQRGVDPDEFIKTYFPIVVYSRFSGTDKTQVLDYDGGSSVTYRCLTSGNVETIDYRKTPIVKLPWKIDWPMRWGVEGVHFEPGGKDHATPRGSFDVAAEISRAVFSRQPPVFQGYEFIGIQGGNGKMSGSAGGAVSPRMLLDIYEPTLLKWMYLRRSPMQSFNLAFDSEVVRQYDEFDHEVKALRRGASEPVRRQALELSAALTETDGHGIQPIPFKQAVSLGQVAQWNSDRVLELAEKSGSSYARDSVVKRLPKARAWLVRYNPEEIISFLEAPNEPHALAMDQTSIRWVMELKKFLDTNPTSIATIEETLYAIPKHPAMTTKQLKESQRAFFRHVYQLLIGKDTGPRLATFLWASDSSCARYLLDLGHLWSSASKS